MAGGNCYEQRYCNDVHVDCMLAVLDRPHLKALLEHFDDKAFAALQRVKEIYVPSEEKVEDKPPEQWSDEWAVWVRDKMEVGRLLPGVGSFYAHLFGTCIEKVC